MVSISAIPIAPPKLRIRLNKALPSATADAGNVFNASRVTGRIQSSGDGRGRDLLLFAFGDKGGVIGIEVEVAMEINPLWKYLGHDGFVTTPVRMASTSPIPFT